MEKIQQTSFAAFSPQAVVFDFDGTLAELNIDFKAMRQAVIDLTRPYLPSSADLSALHVLEMIEEAGNRVGRRDPALGQGYRREALALVTGMEMEAAGRGRLLEGTREMLLTLRRRGLRVGVITRNCQGAVQAVFPDMADYSDALATRESTPLVKPHPEHLAGILRQLGIGPDRAVMVGDHPMDIQVGRMAGARTVGVLTGNTSRGDLERAGADLVLERATDLPSHLAWDPAGLILRE